MTKGNSELKPTNIDSIDEFEGLDDIDITSSGEQPPIEEFEGFEDMDDFEMELNANEADSEGNDNDFQDDIFGDEELNIPEENNEVSKSVIDDAPSKENDIFDEDESFIDEPSFDIEDVEGLDNPTTSDKSFDDTPLEDEFSFDGDSAFEDEPAFKEEPSFEEEPAFEDEPAFKEEPSDNDKQENEPSHHDDFDNLNEVMNETNDNNDSDMFNDFEESFETKNESDDDFKEISVASAEPNNIQNEDNLIADLSSEIIEPPKKKKEKVQKPEKTKGEPKKSGGGAVTVVATGVISSALTAASIVAYDVFVKQPSELTESQVEDMIAYKTKSLKRTISKEIKTAIADGAQQMDSDLAQELENTKLIVNQVLELAQTNTTHIERVSKSNQEIKQSLIDESNEQARLQQKIEEQLANIGSAKSEDGSINNKKALKAIYALKKEIEKVERSAKSQIKSIEQQLELTSIDQQNELLKAKEELTKQLDAIKVATNDTEEKVASISKRIGNQQMNDVQSALGLETGVNIVKQQSQRKYISRGVINGKAFLEVPVEGGGSKIVPFKTGDYLDGYGKIIKIDPKSKQITTETGLVDLQK